MDTTVILAQLRVSRLRADAGCTVCRGSAGARPGKPVHRRCKPQGGLLTPQNLSHLYWNLAQQNRDIVVGLAPFLLAVLYMSYNSYNLVHRTVSMSLVPTPSI